MENCENGAENLWKPESQDTCLLELIFLDKTGIDAHKNLNNVAT